MKRWTLRQPDLFARRPPHERELPQRAQALKLLTTLLKEAMRTTDAKNAEVDKKEATNDQNNV